MIGSTLKSQLYTSTAGKWYIPPIDHLSKSLVLFFVNDQVWIYISLSIGVLDIGEIPRLLIDASLNILVVIGVRFGFGPMEDSSGFNLLDRVSL